MSMSTAAISNSASVCELNPPVSTSTTTGRKPRKRVAKVMGGSWDILNGPSLRRFEPPTYRLAGAIGDECAVAEGESVWRRPWLLEQRDAVSVPGHTVEIGAEMTGKG